MSSAIGSKSFNLNTKWLTCIGDSITNSDWSNLYISKTYQYPKLIQQMIGGNCRELNKGVPGDKTSDALARIWDILYYTPTVATIYLGINDNLQSVDVATTQANIQSIIDKIKATGCNRIIICNIHPIYSSDGLGNINTAYAARRTAIASVASSNSIPLCDFNTVDTVFPTDYVVSDGIHLQKTGLVKLANKLKSVIDAQGWTTILQN